MKLRAVIYRQGFSPQKIVEALDAAQICQAVNEAMAEWGCPKRIKIDNGLPLVPGGNKDIPTLTQLWWIGLGIEVKLNDANTPQQNGTVEGLQGICYRWSNPAAYQDMASFQQRINETNRIQREVYRIRKQGDKTRRELFPELWQNSRQYDPENFNIQKVCDNLATKVWERKVNKGGNFQFWATVIYIGPKFEGQTVTITYDPSERQWFIRAKDGRLLRTYTKEFFTEVQLLEHAGISKNLGK